MQEAPWAPWARPCPRPPPTTCRPRRPRRGRRCRRWATSRGAARHAQAAAGCGRDRAWCGICSGARCCTRHVLTTPPLPARPPPLATLAGHPDCVWRGDPRPLHRALHQPQGRGDWPRPARPLLPLRPAGRHQRGRRQDLPGAPPPPRLSSGAPAAWQRRPCRGRVPVGHADAPACRAGGSRQPANLRPLPPRATRAVRVLRLPHHRRPGTGRQPPPAELARPPAGKRAASTASHRARWRRHRRSGR